MPGESSRIIATSLGTLSLPIHQSQMQHSAVLVQAAGTIRQLLSRLELLLKPWVQATIGLLDNHSFRLGSIPMFIPCHTLVYR